LQGEPIYWLSSFLMVSMGWNEFSRAQGAGRGFGCCREDFWEIAGKSSVKLRMVGRVLARAGT
jgi:hypothetical protein